MTAEAEMTLSQLQTALDRVTARIAAACERAGRNPAEVRLLPVTKTHSVQLLRTVYAAGLRWVGENKAQEAGAKAAELADLPDLKIAMIGHLQSNKAKDIARFAAEFHGLDSVKLARVLNDRLALEGRTMDVLVQVNCSGEPQKSGFAPAEVAAVLPELAACPQLRLTGLMTMAKYDASTEEVRATFRRLAQLRDELQANTPAGGELRELSMGMSGDYEIAIEEGATIVRLGTALFGARSYAATR